MTQNPENPGRPDLAQGIALAELPDGGKLVGRFGDDDVLLVRVGAEVFAVGARCTHYHGPLVEGLVVGDTVRCPWHHACFDLRTGEAARPPAFSPLPRWSVEERDGRVFVTGKLARAPATPRSAAPAEAPRRIVIVGGGAAGFAAAETLRREAFPGSIVMLSDDAAPPVDRPNLSKDYLAGTAPRPGCRCAPRASMRSRASTFASGRRSPASTRGRARSRSPTAAGSAMTGCCWRPGPSRSAPRSLAGTVPKATPCGPWPTVMPSSSAPRRRAAPSCSGQASSG